MSKIEVNTVEPQCGTTLTLGGSGDTVSLGSGASQTGFGRTGTVDWVTTPKVTGDSPITAVTGKGYFLNTTAGTITINLPAGAAGSIVSMADYAATWQTYAVTVAANGSEKIGGVAETARLTTQGQSVTFVYVDSTQGWVNIMDSTSNVRGGSFIVATGGTPCAGTTCGDYKIHTFTGPGTFCVSEIGASAPVNVVDYLVVAGGGAGGGEGGGGGGGGYRESPGTATGSYTVSPRGAAPAAALPVAVAGYPVVVGGGGAIAPAPQNTTSGGSGNDSVFTGSSTITSAGGGGGGAKNAPSPTYNGLAGGSGGGAGRDRTGPAAAGNTPPTNPAQGMPGGISSNTSYAAAGGGGGAICAGGDASNPSPAPTEQGGPGGTGGTSSIDGTPTERAGGGGGGSASPACTGGSGSGGGGAGGSPAGGAGVAGGVNTGGGGGGDDGNCTAGGGSGVVIIRYKFQ